ncbi:MAG: ATPase [uncultured bacterium]|nr:MAG: ATPase [uncultured bacterium]
MQRNIINELMLWKQKKNRKPLIMKGARQVGKTYILKEFGANHFPKYHYFNFEKDVKIHDVFLADLNPKRIIQELNFAIQCSIDIQNDLVIFDEIQHCPKALTSLKYFAEDMPELAICSAGSLIGVYLADVSFPVGQVDFLKMYPLSFEEFLLGIGENQAIEYLTGEREKLIQTPMIVHDRLWELLKIYFVVGGLPSVVNMYHENQRDLFVALNLVRQKQEDLISSYFADMAKHAGKENAMQIAQVLKNIPQQLAREQNGSASRYSFSHVLPGISKYSRLVGKIHWLESAGLIFKIPVMYCAQLPFSAFVKENIFKLYLFDVGILGALSDLPVKTILDYDYGTYKGYFAENFVAQEFFCSGVNALYAWRENTSEVEFIREVAGDILPIEVKSGWVTQAKSLKVFAEKYKSKFRTIMSANPLHVDEENKVHRYALYLAARFPL